MIPNGPGRRVTRAVEQRHSTERALRDAGATTLRPSRKKIRDQLAAMGSVGCVADARYHRHHGQSLAARLLPRIQSAVRSRWSSYRKARRRTRAAALDLERSRSTTRMARRQPYTDAAIDKGIGLWAECSPASPSGAN